MLTAVKIFITYVVLPPNLVSIRAYIMFISEEYVLYALMLTWVVGGTTTDVLKILLQLTYNDTV